MVKQIKTSTFIARNPRAFKRDIASTCSNIRKERYQVSLMNNVAHPVIHDAKGGEEEGDNYDEENDDDYHDEERGGNGYEDEDDDDDDDDDDDEEDYIHD
ncbi:trigger factor-like [Schistocerca nitens]|uniref:trigger factor-like n=1 Tax=Schistocerca nitens TaxID=7011 RepID=UPI0021177E77|nr:trigger factor-like [Schistocerca nitens]